MQILLRQQHLAINQQIIMEYSPTIKSNKSIPRQVFLGKLKLNENYRETKS